ncbi:MAG: hypothetical protein KAJ95_06065 [Gammaproteobacteria bacterium]|nr:hypothetical protein [Gammaproteobacteria bacterium]
MKNNDEGSEKDVIETPLSEQEKRRKAVKSILLTGGSVVTAAQLGKSGWTKPVIESVVLPAHAQTSIDPGFSINDPVFLSYVCGDNRDEDVIVDIGGFLDVQIAGIRVRLELSWSGSATGITPTDNTSPLILEVLTAADGTYSSTGHDIGHRLDLVEVVASLPDFPSAGTASDFINPANTNSPAYYCAPAPTTTPAP